MTATEIVQSFNDTALHAALTSSQRAVRDNEGNLRGLTDAEVEFIAATRAEAKRRGMI